MGYNTFITGGVVITPAVDLKKLEHLNGDEGGYFALTFLPGDQDVQVVNGQVTVVGTKPDTIMVDFYYEEPIKAYDFDDQLAELVNIAKSEGSVVNGTFHGDGEESNDFWATIVDKNVIHTERGSITYPADTKRDKAAAWQEAHDAICTLHGVHRNCHTNPYRTP